MKFPTIVDASKPGRAGYSWLLLLPIVVLLVCLGACSRSVPVGAASADGQDASLTTVGVTSVTRKPMSRQITVSSELVPDQEIDVYAKESGFVKELLVDYGSRVQKGQLLAILEIPELEIQLQQDAAAIGSASERVTLAQHEVQRLEEQHKVVHAFAQRMNGVAKTQPNLVAQQEIDDAQGKDLALEAQVEGGKASYQTAEDNLQEAKAKQQRDQVLFDYSKITAPFAGVVTQRYANYGTLMQAGTSSSTNVLPLVKLSRDDLFRLVIPVPESYIKYIHIGDPVQVRVTSLDKIVQGTVKRFSMDVATETRTMHTEVELPNPSHTLLPGLFAEATLTLDRKNSALVLPLQAISQASNRASIFLVDPNDTLQQRDITLGIQTPNDAEVLSGLNEGDRVVVSDRSGLKPGMHVRAQEVDLTQYQSGTSQ